MRKEYDFKKGKRGAVLPAPTGKTRITIRLDDDILEWFRGQADAAGGGNYQSMINEALRTIATEGPAKIETVGLIRFRGHPTKGGYRGKDGKPNEDTKGQAHIQ